MKDELIIELNGLHFFACHGLYAEERLTGNEFEVNIVITYLPVKGLVTGIHQTINYATVFELVKREMQKPRDLLETWAMETADMIREEHPLVRKIQIGIKKLNPPIAGFTGSVGVTYLKEF